MQGKEKPYAVQFIEDAKALERCEWCARDKPLYRKGLWRHCWDIRSKLARLEKLAAKHKRNMLVDWELRERARKKDCVIWGKMLPRFLGHVDSLDLEHWFCMVEKRIARDDRVCSNLATMLGWTFSPDQHGTDR